MAETKLKVASRRNVIRSLGQPKVAVMLMLGFSSGLPFMLSANTLGYWLRDVGTHSPSHRISVVGRPRLLAQVPLGADRRSGSMLRCSVVWGVAAVGCCLTQLLVAAGLIGLSMRGPAPWTRGRRRLRARGRLLLVNPGHRRRRLAHRGGERFRRVGPPLGRLSARLSRRRCS